MQKKKLVATRVFDSVSRFENSVCVNQWIFELQGRITILGSEVHFVGVMPTERILVPWEVVLRP